MLLLRGLANRYQLDSGLALELHAAIDLKRAGYELLAVVRVGVAGPNIKKLLTHFKENPRVLECHRVTGEDRYIVKIAVPSRRS